MKYNALLVFGSLILSGTGCQFVRGPMRATEAGSPTVLTSVQSVELLRLPPIAATVKRSRPAPATDQYPDRGTFANFDTPPSAWRTTRADTFSLWEDIRDDHENFYTWKNTKTTTGMFAIAAVLAHSDADREFRNAWQEDVRSNSWDDLSSIAHDWGDGRYLIAASCAAVGVGRLASHTRSGEMVEEWGQRSARSLLVGFPPLLLLQRITGASRPLESSTGSNWVLFGDENGVSGHTFVGAVPFICAAQMTDNRFAAISLYTCSTLTGVSRINHDAHYTSQVILGWWMAHMACKSTDETEDSRRIKIAPIPISGGGLGIGIQWEH
jgi:hypothetical protein